MILGKICYNFDSLALVTTLHLRLLYFINTKPEEVVMSDNKQQTGKVFIALYRLKN